MGITDSNNLYRKISPDIITQNEYTKVHILLQKKISQWCNNNFREQHSLWGFKLSFMVAGSLLYPIITLHVLRKLAGHKRRK
jgi:hypothetical protein